VSASNFRTFKMLNSHKIELHGYYTYKPSAWILTEGEDAHGFLQSQFSNDLGDLKIGQVSYGLWLDQKGKVHGDSHILRTGEEEFYLFSYSTPEDLLLEKLNSFIVADDVELEGLSEDMEAISLIGNAVDALTGLGLSRQGVGTLLFEDREVYKIPGRRGCSGSIELIVQNEGRDSLSEALADGVEHRPALSDRDMEALRILNRVPSVPLDIGSAELPQEGGLHEDAVSFNKGCYLGQEVMSRIHSMGQTRRSLRLVNTNGPVEYGSEVVADGKRVGFVKSSVEYGDSYFALALLSNTVTNESTLLTGDSDNEQVLTLVG
jgi:folate-binding protein YgfZ